MKTLSVIAVVLVVLILLLSTQRVESWVISEKPFDIVYTWVDSTDPDFMREKEKYASHENKIGEANQAMRYEMLEELRYSLRSLDQHCPNFRKVFIVVADGQKPDFVDFDHPSIELVTHSQIIPSQYLPTFNSLCIESFLHLIPGLLDRYVYFNDDLILNADVRFFNHRGEPIISHEIRKDPLDNIDMANPPEYTFDNMMAWNYAYIREKYGLSMYDMSSHAPSACLKPAEDKMIDLSDKRLQKTAASKFRQTDNMAFTSVIRPIFYKHVMKFPSDSFNTVILLKGPGFLSDLSKAVNSPDTKVIVINSMDPYDVRAYHEIMKQRFPIPSRFEKN